MNFYNFIYKSISIYFYLRKVVYKNYFLKIITLFAKEFLIKKKKKFNLLFLKITSNHILIKEKEFI